MTTPPPSDDNLGLLLQTGATIACVGARSGSAAMQRRAAARLKMLALHERRRGQAMRATMLLAAAKAIMSPVSRP